MRCPKCGFNSFDHLQTCKKCGKDLSEHKQRFGIKDMLLAALVGGNAGPAEAEEVPTDVDATEPAPETAASAEAPQAADEDLAFEFSLDEEEDAPLDTLFEDDPQEGPQQDTVSSSDTLPEDPSDTSDMDWGEEITDDSDPFANTISLESSDLGLDDAREETPISEESTELGLDDDDFISLTEEELSGDEEDPDHPFGGKENLLGEGSSDTRNQRSHSTERDDEPIDFLTALEIEASSVPPPQEDFFSSDSTELPPLKNTPAAFEERAYSADIPGAADDFSLGALPTTATAEDRDRKPSAVERVIDPFSDNKEPTSIATPAGVPPSFGKRFSAFCYDLILLTVVTICFVLVAETALSGQPQGLLSLERLIDLSIPYFLVIFFLAFGYFTLFHFLTGQTPGKMFTGLRVETTNGDPIAFSQAFMRSVGGLTQLLPAGLGYLTVLRRDGRGWNDQLAGTRLISLASTTVEKEKADQPG